MALTQLVNLNQSANTAGFNLQLSGAPGGGRGGSCFGDSGGPTFYGGFSSNVIVGVNSWLFGFNRQTCGGTGFAFRTDTEAVIEWILGIVEQYAPGELDEIQFVEAP
jgi:secreted trypsin-like serine protease